MGAWACIVHGKAVIAAAAQLACSLPLPAVWLRREPGYG